MSQPMQPSTTVPADEAAPSCILIGGESLAVQCGAMLQAQGWTIRGVISNAEPVRRWATAQQLPAWSVDMLDQVTSDLAFDWLFSITHLRVVPSAVLARAGRGAVNFHDGPLPRYAGLNAPLWALLAGEPAHGISWHRMTSDVDAGEVLVQRTFPVTDADTALSINARCWEAAVDSFPQLLARLTASPSPSAPPTPLDGASHHRGADRPSGLGRLDPARSSEEWLRLFRVADTGRYPNGFLVPWLWTGRDALIARQASRLPLTESQAAQPAGTLLEVGHEAVAVRVADGAIRLDGIRAVDGTACDVARVLTDAGLGPGAALPAVTTPPWPGAFDGPVRAAVSREASWVERLLAIDSLTLPGITSSGTPHDGARATATWTGSLTLPPESLPHPDRERLLAALSLFVACQTQRERGDVGLATRASVAASQAMPLLASYVPMAVEAHPATSVGDALEAQALRLRTLAERGTYLRTVFARYPSLESQPDSTRRLAVVIGDGIDGHALAADLCVCLHEDGRQVTWYAPRGGYEAHALRRLHERLVAFVGAAFAHPARPIALLPLMGPEERARLTAWGTGDRVAIDEGESIASLFARQAERTPDHVALVCGNDALTYAALLTRADQVARQLVDHGVQADHRVALLCTRTTELVIGMLGILRAGGAYVPIDPAYPAERVALMLADSGARVIVTQRHLAATRVAVVAPDGAPSPAPAVVLLDLPESARMPVEAPLPAVHGTQLAYVIYTSGSTGRPKGVMVEHRQVVNFFRGMDRAIGSTPGVWLAVTSMSFDISVLELLWTLTRGFTVVLGGAVESSTAAQAPTRPVGFSLFYFSADEQEQARDKYRLLMEGARFADTHGFEAVWTPERHFHAFGGLYPNPSVTGAAVAAITTRVGIRAGSCVLPLHHPARVAEEWSVVDNLSGGRAGISFAAGWQPNDFVFRPENYADAKESMFRDITRVQQLWRGEALPFPGPHGEVEVRTLPRPVQRELPVWITTAGNPETFEQAGRFGANLLTHLLGQSVEELARKIAAYRAAWREAGHVGEGRVTLMLHTFVGEDDDAVRAIVRAPMKAYLRTSVGLIKQYAGVFPTLRRRPGSTGGDVDFASLTPEETEALLDFSFERYFTTSALFGSVQTAAAMVEKVRAIGVDELACLVDFGLDTDTVLAHLPHLDALRARCTAEAPAAPRADGASLATLMTRHAATHFQCTPSMARLLLAAPDTREALRGLDVMCVGGEALPPSLAGELLALLRGRLYNMYGPTETTIWSSVQPVQPDAPVSLGRPIVNTTLQVMHPDTRAPLPIGTPGELLVGGHGVVRGYLDRETLTAERFVDATDITGTASRLYRTGDLVQYTDEGHLHFLGRIDHQVKVRGYRIELGEIEVAIARDPGVQEVVVVAQEEVVGDPRLVAYVTERPGTSVSADTLRSRLRESLPEYMVPSQYVVLADMPRTPNLKIDRKALPVPALVSSARASAPIPAAGAPEGDLERTVAAVWCDVLRLPTVGNRDNFFDLGGHSLLVVQVHQRLTTTLQLSFPITDLFRFSTVQTIAAHLAALQAAAGAADEAPATATGAPPGDDISRRAELRRAAAQRHVRPRS